MHNGFLSSNYSVISSQSQIIVWECNVIDQVLSKTFKISQSNENYTLPRRDTKCSVFVSVAYTIPTTTSEGICTEKPERCSDWLNMLAANWFGSLTNYILLKCSWSGNQTSRERINGFSRILPRNVFATVCNRLRLTGRSVANVTECELTFAHGTFYWTHPRSNISILFSVIH